MEIEEVASDIFRFRLFSAEEAADILKDISARGDWRARHTDDADAAGYNPVRRCANIDVTTLPEWRERAEQWFRERIRSAAFLCWNYLSPGISESQFVRYGPGDFVRRHVDFHHDKDMRRRTLSLACTLDDGVAGGETVFPRQRYRIKPRPGIAHLFPATISHPHEVERVIDGVRHGLVVWLL